ncbi:TetR/AcrR family transcriptional regulator [Chryseobacterium sp.]|uniref:TetR/AcrR family transcriptional regulator n=1 Tax=Chryseobacterium sp. TaxID=1871047 RepID=UPI00289918FC|nr:TetR/AcrR family transcriptional regulator [Chryseobacterium sp.]
MTDTESIIKQSTIYLVLKEGNFGVSMQDIVARSKVSRSIIHYYFRSREHLFSLLDDFIVQNLLIPRYEILFSLQPLATKVETYLAEFEDNVQLYPYVDVYSLITFSNSDVFQKYFDSIKPNLEILGQEIQTAINEKEIDYTNPVQFLFDLFSLSSYSTMCFDFLEKNKIFLGFEVTKDLKESRLKSARKILLK